jgi:hypothetical protein
MRLIIVSAFPGTPKLRMLCRYGQVLLLSAAPACLPAAEDADPRRPAGATVKVEPGLTDTGGGEAGLLAENGGTESDRPEPSRAHFETLLERRHLGTYTVYSRLPERSREEVFLDYSGGAPIEALREKIIDRYLHP